MIFVRRNCVSPPEVAELVSESHSTKDMVDFALNAVVIAILLAIHETGHYSAGRLVGIPGTKMRVVLFQWPPHVAVRADATGWVTPNPTDMNRYVEILNQHTRRARDHFVFVGGGHGAEWLAVMGIAGSALAIDHAVLLDAAGRFVQWAFILSAIYVVMDWIGTLRHNAPHGDFSGQWMIHRSATVVFYLVYFGGLVGVAFALGLL